MAARASASHPGGPRARLVGVLLSVSLCAGCAMTADPTSVAIVNQDRFEVNTCPEIIGQRNASVAREKEMAELVAKAESSPGGFIASYAAYRSELALARARLAAANRAMRTKGCEPDKKP